MNTIFADAPPFSPATSTSAQAVPSGYFSLPCCLTMNARRSGIIISMPSRPPSTDTVMTRTQSISKPSSSRAGMVTPTPNAIDSPAEPVVCTMLFSRIVARRMPKAREKTRNRVIDSTAIGTDADTVMPTLSSRYSDDAPKRMPSTAPRMTADQVNSGMTTLSGTNGLCSPPLSAGGGVAAVGSAMRETPGRNGLRLRPCRHGCDRLAVCNGDCKPLTRGIVGSIGIDVRHSTGPGFFDQAEKFLSSPARPHFLTEDFQPTQVDGLALRVH